MDRDSGSAAPDYVPSGLTLSVYDVTVHEAATYNSLTGWAVADASLYVNPVEGACATGRRFLRLTM